MAGTIAATLAGAALYAVLYRLRGGMFSNIARSIGWTWAGKQRTQTMRLIWSLPVALGLFFSLGLPAWQIAALTVSTFASMALIGNGDYLDLKRVQPFPDLVGLLRCSIAIAPAALADPLSAAAYAIAGIVHAKLYAISHRLTGASDLAEYLVGALTGVAIVLIRFI